MTEEKSKLGREKISELGGELGNKMINNIEKLSPPYAKFIMDSVAAMNSSSSLLSRRDREIIRLSSLITAGASLMQIKNGIKMGLKNNIFTKEEIGEIIMQTSFFCGFFPGINAGFVALEAIDEVENEAK